MRKSKAEQKKIYVYADWKTLKGIQLMGCLYASPVRGKEVFSFEYDSVWLKSAQTSLDPKLQFFSGPLYPSDGHANFGIFLDSSPDRWGRVLMRRREAQQAREENRLTATLFESDYLLGVFDGHRMGGLRFKTEPEGPFLDNNEEKASPPWTELRDLEYASLQLEKDDAEKEKDYMKWLKLLLAPGASLGGARPKASVVDTNGELWIAKFPSINDDLNTAGWEITVHELAVMSKINTSPANVKRFTANYDTFLTKRFDRENGQRIHFASAMTLLNKKDGDGAEEGVSYIDLADFLIQNGSQVSKDLSELWRRIVFNICVSNVDDHLRNHGFILTEKGWKLAPAYDMNPSETGNGLKLNITQDDNSQSLKLALEAAEYFRLSDGDAKNILNEVLKAVRQWKKIAKKYVAAKEISRMEHAFRVV